MIPLPWNKEHLRIDYHKHVEYLQSTKRVLRSRLDQRFGPTRSDVLWTKAKHLYEGFLDDLPYIGSRHNLQAHAFYDSLMCFAYWEAMPAGQRESVDEFEETVSLVFNGSPDHARRNPEWLTANNERLLGLVSPVAKFGFAWQNRRVRSGAWGNAWENRVFPPAPGDPLHIDLVGCPVADFARAHGYQHLMPAMCNPDHHSMSGIGCHLVRPQVVAKGDPVCETHIVGDRTTVAAATQPIEDESGYLVNSLPDEAPASSVDPKLPYNGAYWAVIAPLARHFIAKRYGRGLADRAYQGGKGIYRDYIDRAPLIGADNPMAKNLYEACVFFALYTAAAGDITPDMMRTVLRDLFDLPVMRIAYLGYDLRKPSSIAKLNARLRACARWAQDRPAIAGATWDFNFDDDRDGTVAAYHFTRCPINDFCRREGLMEILPVMCETDELTPRLMHGRLTRHNTLALDGPCCDYLIEGE